MKLKFEAFVELNQHLVGYFQNYFNPVTWNGFRLLAILELENFSGKSALSVYQDFHAKVFTKNLVWIMAFPVNNALPNNYETRKYDYQINFTQALSKSKGVIGLLFQGTKSKIVELIAQLQDIFQKTFEPVRPGRKYPRNHKVSVRKFFPAYKPIG